MKKMISVSVFLVCVVWMSSVVAQSPGAKPGELELKPIAASSGTGVSNVQLLDRPEVRVLRVDVAPGGVRNVHTHDDTQFQSSPTSRLISPPGRRSSSRVEPSTASKIPGPPPRRSSKCS
jgi:hypothetical protein